MGEGRLPDEKWRSAPLPNLEGFLKQGLIPRVHSRVQEVGLRLAWSAIAGEGIASMRQAA